jgi:hypothetical protein
MSETPGKAGKAFTETKVVVLLQPVVVFVNVKVVLPADTPVTTPAFVTIALVSSLLTQVPPVVGLKIIVPPIHTCVEDTLTTGKELIVAVAVVVFEQVPFVKL